MPSRKPPLPHRFSTNRHRRIIAEPWRQELYAYREPASPQPNDGRRIWRSVAFKRRRIRWKVPVVKHPGAHSGRRCRYAPFSRGCARFTRLPLATVPARLRRARQQFQSVCARREGNFIALENL